MEEPPGAGKTTWRTQHFVNKPNVYVHDIDEVMIALPGYQEDLEKSGPVAAFEKWMPTAQKVVNELMQFALKKKYSVLYDRTCGTEGSYFDLFHAKQMGYQIHFIGFCIHPEIALSRIAIRQQETGRAVTSEIFQEYRARFSALWPYYLSFVDSAVLYETSENEAREIFSLSNGPKDTIRYKAFLDEGNSFRDYFNQILNTSEK